MSTAAGFRPSGRAHRPDRLRERAADVPPIGYAQLWRADPGAWAAAGAAWRGLTGPIRRRADGLGARIGGLRPGWSGAASATAQGRIGELRTELTDVLPALVEVDQVLAEFAARVAAARARLGAAVAHADAGGLLVDRAGAVRPDPARPRPAVVVGPAVAQVGTEIRGALALAGAADREAADRLAELTTAAVTGWVSVPPAGRPSPGAGPAEVSRWWAGLTPAERRWLVSREPDRVGRLDGVPVAARDQANRLLLARWRAELVQRRNGLLRPRPAGPLELARLARLAAVEAALRGLDGLGERLAAPGAPGRTCSGWTRPGTGGRWWRSATRTGRGRC
ncbi:hypothetical protein [Micromonospora sp. NPDC005299]|uniref:hypothetical protein n=1 Tax=Micromonospora sp. NPDC005299 TaxID=3364231 RepID=UPI00368F4241